MKYLVKTFWKSETFQSKLHLVNLYKAKWTQKMFVFCLLVRTFIEVVCMCNNSTFDFFFPPGYDMLRIAFVFCFCVFRVFFLCESFLIWPSNQGQLFSRFTREWYRRLLPRSISSKWSKGEFTLLTFLCTVAVLTFNCLSVFRANSHLVPDNCAILGLPLLSCHTLGHHLKRPL